LTCIGSGKTLAFGIPVIAGILRDKEKEEEQSQDLVEEDVDEAPESESENEEDMSDQEAENGCVKVYIVLKNKPYI